MEYRNTKTGAIITSPCKIKGGDWVGVEKSSKPAKSVKKSSKG